MSIRSAQWHATADGTGAGSASSTDIVDGVIHGVHLRLIYKVAFTSGSVEPQPGDTLSGATGGATARVYRAVKTSGQWGLGNAAGDLWLTEQSGTFEAENLDNDTSGDANIATIAADTTGPDATNTVTVEEANEWPPLPVLVITDLTADAWYYPRVALHDPTDGTVVTGPVDYQSLGNYVSLAIAGFAEGDSILVTVRWDDMRR